MELQQALLPHLETVAWVLAELDDEHGEPEEFLAGLRPILHEAVDCIFRLAPDETATQSLLRQLTAYIDSWVVSLRLHRDPQWQDQVEQTRKRVANGELGGPIDAGDLGRLLEV